MYFTKKILPKLALVSCCTALHQIDKKYSMSKDPILSEIIRGEYENKIRRYSPPQKIFDVFATIYKDGCLYMTLHDLIKAICFYNFSESDPKETDGFQPETIIRFIGKKDKFEIYDYFLLVRFLAFDRKKIENYFNENVKGNMEKEQLQVYIRDVVCSDYDKFIKPPIGLQSRQFRPDQKAFENSINQTVESMLRAKPQGFGLNDIIEFRSDMIREIYSFEFLMFKLQDKKIDGADFARSIIKYVESSKKRRYMNKIKDIRQEIEKIKINQDSYVGFHFYMQTNIEQLNKQLSTKGAFNEETLFNLINKYVTEKRQVTRDQVKILMRILDLDDSGFIEKRQFMGVLGNLQYYTQVKSGESSFTDLMIEDIKKIKDQASRIYDILRE